MEVIFHPLVQRDVEEAFSYYRRISERLSDEFRDELRTTIAHIAENPEASHESHGFRRTNLKRFPYHILYEISAARVRVMLVRHNKRNPQYGLSRS